jgi:Ca2+-binding RTX toxin-like protein
MSGGNDNNDDNEYYDFNVYVGATTVGDVGGYDSPNGSYEFDIVGGPDADKFRIDEDTGVITFKQPATLNGDEGDDQEGSAGNPDGIYHFTIEQPVKYYDDDGWDKGWKWKIEERDITVKVNQEGETLHQKISVDENTTEVTSLGNGFSIVSGSDKAKFDIVDGKLVFIDGPDYEHPTDTNVGGQNTYYVNVKTPQGNLLDFQVHVRDVSSIVPHEVSVDEGSTGVVYDIGYGATITGLDADKFTVDANGKVTFLQSPDFENPHDSGTDNVYNFSYVSGEDTHNVEVRVLNTDDNEIVWNVADPVVGATNEDTKDGDNRGVVVGHIDLNALDLDGSVTYQLVDSNDGRFSLDPETGDVKVVGRPIDFEEQHSLDIVVRANSSDGSFVDKTFTIDINDVWEREPNQNIHWSIGGQAATNGDDVIDLRNSSEYLNPGSGPFNENHHINPAEAGSGHDTVFAGDGNDIVYGAAGNDALYGEWGNDRIGGGDDHDVIFGGRDNDVLYGDGGNDYLNGGENDDVSYGGDGDDQIHDDWGNDWLLGGNGNDTMAGNDGNDRLYGENGNDWLHGGAGDDILAGGQGGDRLDGSWGNDVLYGEWGNDVLLGNLGNDVLAGQDSDDYLNGEQNNDVLIGGAGKDLLDGSYGNDVLYGEDGNDTLYGSVGNDVLFGGAGADIFMQDKYHGYEHIGDFQDGVDKIQLRNFGITAENFKQNVAMTQHEWGVQVKIQGTDFLNVVGTDTAHLNQNDFILTT